MRVVGLESTAELHLAAAQKRIAELEAANSNALTTLKLVKAVEALKLARQHVKVKTPAYVIGKINDAIKELSELVKK